MKLRAILLTLLLASALALPVSVMAAETGAGRIEGLVFNSTQNSNVADQEVTLTTYLNSNELESKTARTDAKGVFVFQGLSVKTGYNYDVKTNYQLADYTSDKVDFGDGSTTKAIQITVYDSTTSTESLTVDTAHTIISADKNGLLINSYEMVANAANLTYIGIKELAPDKRETLKFVVPPGSKELQYGLTLMGCCVIPGDGNISDTMPVLPGTREVVYSYTVPYKSNTYELTQTFDLPTKQYDLLIEGDTIKVANAKLMQVDPVAIEGKQYSRYSALDMAAGEVLRVELSGLPQNSRQSIFKWIGLGLVALAFTGGFFVLVRRRKVQPVPVAVKGNDGIAQQKQQLLLEIARLDDSFEAGLIVETVYQPRRADKKRQLLKLMQLMADGK